MRRKDRQIQDFDEIIHIMEQCDSCVLAWNDQGFPYVVPLNFGMEVEDGQVYLYFHCAPVGTKLDLIRRDNRATFEMDCGHSLILHEEKMSCTMGYSSVIGHGTIEFVAEEDKLRALRLLMRHYHAEDFHFNTAPVPATTVLRLKVSDMTGKRRSSAP